MFAHALEKQFLDGSTDYQPPDVDADGGLMPKLARFFPRHSANVSHRLQLLPDDGTVPPMPGWQWIHTPGHTPGHVSFWRETDRVLIAGDAVITTRQESAYAIAAQSLEMYGPPKYFTPDWQSARTSVQRLAALEPELIITGHGRAMHGEIMRHALHTLADDFDRIAVPDHLQRSMNMGHLQGSNSAGNQSGAIH